MRARREEAERPKRTLQVVEARGQQRMVTNIASGFFTTRNPVAAAKVYPFVCSIPKTTGADYLWF